MLSIPNALLEREANEETIAEVHRMLISHLESVLYGLAKNVHINRHIERKVLDRRKNRSKAALCSLRAPTRREYGRWLRGVEDSSLLCAAPSPSHER